MSWSSKWSPLWIFIFIFLKCGTSSPTMTMEGNASPMIIVAASHTALSGDLAVLILELPSVHRRTTELTTTTENADIVMEEDDGSSEKSETSDMEPFVLRVLRLNGFTSELIGEVLVESHTSTAENVSLTIPCGFFSRGGTYSLILQLQSTPVPTKLVDMAGLYKVQMKTTLDVRWPVPSLSLEPQHFDTYPSQPILATLEYTGISCSPIVGVPITTYSLQLIYCGSSVISCDPQNRSHVQMLYSEEVKGFPAQRVLTLRCEFFGLAGHYALRLKPSDANPSAPTISTYIKVEWSDQFVFNVHARSVYPCDGGSGGVSVLFEYPSCRLSGDRVRVYGRLRADVASLAPPSTLHYVAELKAPAGKHTLTFDCDIFTERFVEYCFVYVSQAINGAMAEVRVDCVPTFPLQEGDAGGWGPWSEWTPCSSSCVGGTRNRYRFCDTPPPRYGAKFCQGKAVETESCGGATQLDLHGSWSPGDWECRHGKGLAADRPEVSAEIGSKCRCGCVLNLTDERPRKILAASTQACPGRSFWLIQVDLKSVARLHFDQARFPCPGQYVRARDGDSLSAELLADVAFDKTSPPTGTVVSSNQKLLLEFFSDEITAAGESCIGGFLAHVTIFPKPFQENDTTTSPTIFLGPKVMAAAGKWALWLTPAHLVAALLLILMFLVSLFLALQYALKYRKYQIAEDLDSLTDSSAYSGSMQGLARRARAMSSSTLISEVVSLVRLPKRGSPKHAKLEEMTGDGEDEYDSSETQREEDENDVESETTLKPKESEDTSSEKTVAVNVRNIPKRSYSSLNASVHGQPEVKYARPVKLRTAGRISPVSEEASTSEESRRHSGTSASTSLNNGFSPSSASSNASTLRCGKESKDRRNREKLLQGPGSEFSLANPDTDLEIDYYDYNVVNASAAPGSYLGMDPAFLVWIPPLDPGEPDILSAIDEGRQMEEASASPAKKLNTEGASLSPAEYQRLCSSKSEDGEPSRFYPGECRLHDEIIMEYRARLGEGLLPIHRILEESRVRVSEESLSTRHSQDEAPSSNAIIPNRLGEESKTESRRSGSRSSNQLRSGSRSRIIDDQERVETGSLPRTKPQSRRRSRTKSVTDDERESSAASVRNRLQENVRNLEKDGKDRRIPDLDRDVCETKPQRKPKTPMLPRKYRDIVELNSSGDKKKGECCVNIPLTEFVRRQDSPAKVHRVPEKKIQSPDYGVEADYGDKEEQKESIYGIIGEGEDGLKFADEEEDEYVDNKVVA